MSTIFRRLGPTVTLIKRWPDYVLLENAVKIERGGLFSSVAVWNTIVIQLANGW